jgi:ribosomal protein L37E
MVEPLDFYAEKKYCSHCQDYVPYLASLARSYCASCGHPVNLFSKEDWQKFRRRIAKPMTGRKSSFLTNGQKKGPRPSVNDN